MSNIICPKCKQKILMPLAPLMVYKTVMRVCKKHKWILTRAAVELGIDAHTLRRWVHRYYLLGADVPRRMTPIDTKKWVEDVLGEGDE